MRPSLDIDPGLLVPPSQRSGTGRHTLPDAPAALRERLSLDGVADEFFSEGDAGTYEGGPAVLAPDLADEPELASVQIVVRTPEMDARRARGIRVVASVVGCLAALLAFAAVRVTAAERQTASSPGVVTPRAPAAPAAAFSPAPVQRDEPPAAHAPAAPKVEAPQPRASRGAVAVPEAPRVAAPPRAVAPAPAHPATRASQPAPALPSVANFAARPAETPKAQGKVPTASFAPQ